MTTLKDGYERLTAIMEPLEASQNQPPPHPPTPLQRTVIFEIVFTPLFLAPISAPQHHIPSGVFWGMPPKFMPEGYPHEVSMTQPVMSVPPPMVHLASYVEELIFHVDQRETVGVYKRMDKFQDNF